MFPPRTSPATTSALLVVTGDLDLGAIGELWHRAVATIDTGAADLRLDLTGVTFIDCAGIGVLIRIKHLAAEHGLHVQVTSSPRVSRLLRLTGLGDDFDAAA